VTYAVSAGNLTMLRNCSIGACCALIGLTYCVVGGIITHRIINDTVSCRPGEDAPSYLLIHVTNHLI
jgi:hypothetical protein